MRLAAGPLLAWLWWRGRREPAYRERLHERLGFVPIVADRMGGLWVHAASMGEVQAATPLLEALLERWPNHSLLVTTQTPTGLAALRRRWGDRIAHAYAPLDTPGAIARFLDRTRPQALLLLERELWPLWLRACAERAIPVALLNARLSDRSTATYQRWSHLMAHVWPQLHVGAADESAANHLIRLGVPANAVHLTGNLKFDVPTVAALEVVPPELNDRRLVVAGSTHADDEAALLKAWVEVSAQHPEALLVLAPRHPQRFEAVSRHLEQSGWPHARRSRTEWPAPHHRVYLLDTMGELPAWYARSDVCVVGGTFAPVGGHNPLEPLSVGQPLVFGPHTFNAASLYQDIVESGAGIQVADSAVLRDSLVGALRSPETWIHRRAQARALMERNQGATERCARVLDQAIGPVWPEELRPVRAERGPTGDEWWFDPGHMTTGAPHLFASTAASQTQGVGSGRGQIAVVPIGEQAAVIRHYRRGGLMARLSRDRFWREAAHRSRAMSEYQLLRLMRAWRLPVPVPVAAHQCSAWLTYTADIAMGLIPDSRNLVEILRNQRPGPASWQAVGRVIRQLHDRQVFHGDLNAHNLLLDSRGQAWVIDFDKSGIRPGSAWKTDNLNRLLRSLRKEAGRQARFHWTEDDWPWLLKGYESTPPGCHQAPTPS